MTKVLFVDDEPHVLDGLRRSMRCMRDQWDTRYSLSAAEALMNLAFWQADVVVTDMQMSGIDGAKLLREIKRLYPGMIRFVLSGHAKPSAVVQAAATAHQYLPKPCDAGVLRAAIGRAQALRAMLGDARIADWGGGAEALPSLPAAYQRITACLQDGSTSIADVANVINEDLAVSTMLLKLANSAFFGSGQTIRTVDRAVSFLGIDIVASLVLASGVFVTSAAEKFRVNVEALWQHSLLTASIARQLALHENWSPGRADDAFLAGMLHDVGHLVIATSTPAGTPESPDDIDHGQVGAYLVGLWGFPDDLVEAIAFHHRPSRANSPDLSLASLVHAANLLAQRRKGDCGVGMALDMDEVFFSRAGMLDRWRMWQSCGAASPLGEIA